MKRKAEDGAAESENQRKRLRKGSRWDCTLKLRDLRLPADVELHVAALLDISELFCLTATSKDCKLLAAEALGHRLTIDGIARQHLHVIARHCALLQRVTFDSLLNISWKRPRGETHPHFLHNTAELLSGLYLHNTAELLLATIFKNNAATLQCVSFGQKRTSRSFLQALTVCSALTRVDLGAFFQDDGFPHAGQPQPIGDADLQHLRTVLEKNGGIRSCRLLKPDEKSQLRDRRIADSIILDAGKPPCVVLTVAMVPCSA
jgi:hypothetical protein